MTLSVEALVFDATEPWLTARTLRALAGLGLEGSAVTNAELAPRLAATTRPVWLVRAGAWPLSAPSPVLAHASGPVVAVGATALSAAWQEILARTGGDLSRMTHADAVRVDSAIAFEPDSFAQLLRREGSVDKAVFASTRVVRAPSLDAGYQATLRIVQGVTTLQRGGAERVVLELARELRALGHDVLLAVLDRAARSTFPDPSGTVHLRDLAHGRAERLDQLLRLARDRGADVVHVHLFDGDDITRLAAGDLPIVVTVHNSEPGWPTHFGNIAGAAHPPLLFACSRDVGAALHAAGLGARTRTAWNGIQPTPRVDRAEARRRLGLPAAAPVLVAIANFRPQKRLDRLPAILAAVRDDAHLDARLLLVGEPVSSDPEALAIEGRIRAEAAQHGVTEQIVFAGSHADMGVVYAAADAVLSASAFEGLSLVHLEAIAAGVPLVTTRVAGTEELAAKHAGVLLVALEASPSAFAAAITSALATRTPAKLAPDFTARAMAERHAELYPRAVVTPRRGGLVLVANNFSTGGAQSSARRLLMQLHGAGIAVRAIVIEEQADHPTPGRRALEAAGIPVHVAPRAGTVDPLVTAHAVAALVDAAPPDALVFWNAISEHKVLIADLLVGTPMWDVSPGEMYFASFDKYLERPRVGSPYLGLRDYGRLLQGVIVKYEAERGRAADALGAPVHVVPNGVDVPASPLRRAGSARVVGTLARLSPDKKLEELLAAARIAKERGDPFELVIAGAAERGNTDYSEALRASAADLPVTWAGEREARDFLAGLDMFAMISEPGGCPNASLEAMAAGLPTIATDHGGAREQLDGVGILVPRANPTALADAITRFLPDAGARARMGDAAHKRASERFDVRRMAADYTRIFGLRAYR